MKLFQIVSIVLGLLKYSTENDDKFQFRISGGERVDPNKYYPVVSFQHKVDSFHFCGGTIIKVDQILSAAHCFLYTPNRIPSEIKVIIGSVYIGSEIKDSFIYMVKKIVRHRDYDLKTKINDIAIVYLQNNILENIYKQTIIPLQRKQIYIGDNCYVLGWGCTGINKPKSKHLLIAEISVYPMDKCLPRLYMMFLSIVYDDLICAGSFTGQDTCRADSGGPLIVDNKLTGITSVAFRKCGLGPGIFTNVTAYYDWIASGRSNKNVFINSFLQIILVIWILIAYVT